MIQEVKDRESEELKLDKETLEWMKERCVLIEGDTSICKISFDAFHANIWGPQVKYDGWTPG